ncbi:MAG: dihydrolipoyl dehydrogenase [Tenericutes bacterium]|jgi:dihydrolipoamide dehydrogenase|nr:dihydrolipoyl dehydrogenase [Mycoplasmatota bacterium]
MSTYDVVILGAGPGGYVAAIKAAQKGLKTAIIEKEAIGGVCLNWGCIPTKSLLKSAKVYTQFMHAKDYGIDVANKDDIKPNWKAIIKRKDRIVRRLTGGVKMLLKKNNVDIYEGFGEIKNKYEIIVNDETIKTKNIILSTGASPILPPIDGLKNAYDRGFVMTSKQLLDIDEIPKELVVIGGGVIGLEFATIFNSFGTKVTIIEREDKILLNVDDDVRDAILKIIKKDKINVFTEATVNKIGDKNVTYKTSTGEEKTIDADKVLLSVGMKANLKGYESLNLKTERNFVEINDYMQTSLDNVYAIGDMNGKMMLAHVASHQGIIAINHILGEKETMNYKQMPSAIYSFPEIAQIGYTEKEAKEAKLDFKTSTFPVQANGRALSANETDGFIKIIASKKYNEILGVHIVASNASDLISEAVMTMKLEGTADEIANAVHPHPTMSEIFNEAAWGIVDKPIHI